MPETPSDLDERLRAHLGRVADVEPRAGLETRAIEHAHAPQPVQWRGSLATAALIVVVVVTLVLLTTGHQVNNVFSNVSNGLSG